MFSVLDDSFISSEPKEVVVSDITYSSAKLTWQKPDTVEDIVYYKICCRESAKQDCVYKLAEPNSTSTVVNDLKESTEYDIHIRPYTSKGPGNSSKKILFNTTAGEWLDMILNPFRSIIKISNHGHHI